MKRHRTLIRHTLILFTLITLLGCHAQSKNRSHETTLTIEPTTLRKTLHFTGIIQPIHESTLTSPVEGTIETIHSPWGQFVARDMIVFTINSADFQKHYNDTLTEYLKAKDSYTVARAKFTGTEELWKAGLLSKNNYLSEKSSLNTERVRLMQSTQNVSELLEKMGQSNHADEELAGLSFSEFDKVHLALMSKHNLIHLKAPRSGVLLYPPKSPHVEKSQSFSIGSNIKIGQVLALIGDMRGLSIEIDIPEVDIGNVQLDMPAIIRGVGFGKQTLNGKLVSINAEASHKNTGGLPSFTATIEVKHLSKEAQAIIKVGMSASVELTTHHYDALLVPIDALSQQKGQTWVNLKQANGHMVARRIKTGTVTGENVVVEEGLHQGETIVYRKG